MDISFTPPQPETFKALRDMAGWGDIALHAAEHALANSLAVITARGSGGACIGICRIVGDGVLNVYLQDVVVHPKYRDRGIGVKIVEASLNYMHENLPEECTIGLMAAREQEGFYTQFGFIPRPTHVYGAGMSAPLHHLHSPKRQRTS